MPLRHWLVAARALEAGKALQFGQWRVLQVAPKRPMEPTWLDGLGRGLVCPSCSFRTSDGATFTRQHYTSQEPAIYGFCSIPHNLPIVNFSRMSNFAQPPPFASGRLGLSQDLHARILESGDSNVLPDTLPDASSPHYAAHAFGVSCAPNVDARKAICKQTTNPIVESCYAICGGSRSQNTFPSGIRESVAAICSKPRTSPVTGEIQHR